jgi:polyhydroxyalkanoate synthesis regulator phasin|tara:strand:+ start:67 stop:294 length:228 start_codon:yes stop_codon:yes gene_type:complete
MFEEVEAADKVKELKKQLRKIKADKAKGNADLEKTIDILETDNSIKDYEITRLKETIDMLKKQKKILQDSIRKHG